ncbi:hypothetical protein ACWDGI_18445 [Streptomyces sp. NPDC001220]
MRLRSVDATPPALGSYSAEREAAQRVGAFPALRAGNPVALTRAEFGSRAIHDSGRSLTGGVGEGGAAAVGPLREAVARSAQVTGSCRPA